MPLTPEQQAALKLLSAADAKEVADALQQEAPTHYQAVYQRGFSTAHNEARTRESSAAAEITALKDQVRQKDEALQQVKTGDVAKLNERITTLEASNQKLTQERDEAKKSGSERVKNVYRTKAEAELGAHFIELGIDPDYARQVLVPMHRARLDVDLTEKDGAESVSVRAFDDDGVTPLQGKEPLRVLAERIKKGVDAKWVKSNADGGGGTGGSGSGGGGKSEYDTYRQQAKDRHKQPGQDTILERRKALLPQS
jgi:hypothetical protein